MAVGEPEQGDVPAPPSAPSSTPAPEAGTAPCTPATSVANDHEVGENGDGHDDSDVEEEGSDEDVLQLTIVPPQTDASSPVPHASPQHQFLVGIGSIGEVYPAAQIKHDDAIKDPTIFLETFYKFHSELGSKPTIPKMGGRDLDVHLLYKEVTGRGGLQQVIRDRKWKEITVVFKFPRTTTSASYVLRKYYVTLLHHFEQVFFFGATGPLIPPPDTAEPTVRKRVRKRKLNMAQVLAVDPGDAIGSTITGAIEGKLDFGYLVTMVVGGEKLRGILYHVPPGNKGPQYASVPSLMNSIGSELSGAGLETHTRRKRRRKEEMPKKDPNAPRPNRTGYNFFFAEQRQRLKQIHPDKDREISKMIGELWTALTEDEKTPYQDRGVKDKERFKKEMRDYRERLKNGDIDAGTTPMTGASPELNEPGSDQPTSMAVETNPSLSPQSEPTPEVAQASTSIDMDPPESSGLPLLQEPVRVPIIGQGACR